MISIWDYADSDRIRIIDIDGKEFVGTVADVTDAGERSDLEIPEDGIAIVTDDKRLIEFYLSEIKSIEVISKKAPKKSTRAAG